jgi:hypothetical protein
VDVDVLELADTETSTVTQYCHLRHNNCSSQNAFCGVFKPFTHSNQIAHAGYWRHKQCSTCDKPICPKCIALDKFVCPQCGLDRW